MKLLILNGPSCAGKSTAVKQIMSQKDQLFHLSYDSLKWSFSQYSPEKHSTQVHTLMLAVAISTFKMKCDIICDSGVLYKDWREKLITLSTEHGYDIVEINLEANFDILSQRFDERVKKALSQPEVRMSNFSKKKHQKLYEDYQKENNNKALTLRTDIHSPEEIVSEIRKLF